MDDPDDNALMVNALQRHATVVAQKSLMEGLRSHPLPRLCGSSTRRGQRHRGIQASDRRWGVRPCSSNRPDDLTAFGEAAPIC